MNHPQRDAGRSTVDDEDPQVWMVLLGAGVERGADDVLLVAGRDHQR
jgi:hypothetical protein